MSDQDPPEPRDEADAYMGQQSPHDRDAGGLARAIPARSGYAPMGPVADTSEHKAMLKQRERERAEAVAWRKVLETEYGAFFQQKAGELSETGRTVIHADLGRIDARVVRFADGSAALETFHKGRRAEGHGILRMDPEIIEGNPLVSQLVSAVLYLGRQARPLTD